MTPSARLVRANELIEVIASCGRRFLRHGDRVGHLEIGKQGRIYYCDPYGSRVYTHHPGLWRGFTSGGTLRGVIRCLRDYVTQGKGLPPRIFGPWPDWINGGDLWGYGKEMELVRDAATRLEMYR